MNTTNQFRGEYQLTFGKKVLKGAFTMNALRLVMKHEGIKLDEFDVYLQGDPLTALPTIAYFGCISEAVKKGTEVKMSLEAFIATMLDTGTGLEDVALAISNALGDDEEAGKE